MIVEIKFRTGSHATVKAYVTKEKPTKDQMESLHVREIGRNMENTAHSFNEWPVKGIFEVPDNSGQYVINLWNEETCTVFEPYYIMETKVDLDKDELDP